MLKAALQGRGAPAPDGGGDPAALARDRLRLHRIPARLRRPELARPLPVRRFHEKPELAKAKRYVEAGNFFWNSGMFFWRADVLLEQLRQHLPQTATMLASLPRSARAQFAASLKQAFPLCDNISIDYAVLEKAAECAAASPPAISAGTTWEAGTPSTNCWSATRTGNVDRPANPSCLDSHNNFVDARGKMVALIGVRDLIVVDTPDALLVAARDRAQQVGDIVKALEKRNRHDLL